jgi:hypothetical protein
VNRRIAGAIALAVVLCAVGMALGSTKYFYLSTDQNTDVTLTKGELAALQLTAYYNNTGSLTSRLIRQSLRAFLGSMSLDIIVDTVVQESWQVSKGGADFAVSDGEVMLAYMEAGDMVLSWVHRYFPDIQPKAVNIVFTIKGFKVGVYQQGKFTIEK